MNGDELLLWVLDWQLRKRVIFGSTDRVMLAAPPTTPDVLLPVDPAQHQMVLDRGAEIVRIRPAQPAQNERFFPVGRFR